MRLCNFGLVLCVTGLLLSCGVNLSSDEAKVGYEAGFELGGKYSKSKYTDEEFEEALALEVESAWEGWARLDEGKRPSRPKMKVLVAGFEQGAEDAREGLARQVSRRDASDAADSLMESERNR